MPAARDEGALIAGKYLIEARVGTGGMSEVYRARNRSIDRVVAIKFLLPELARDARAVRRFMREGQLATRVRHPNVVDILDVDKDADGTPFLVQDYLRGEDLDAHVAAKGGRLTPREALDILGPIADALGHAHARSVVHRDVKPSNIFLALEHGRCVPKLVDFGIARFEMPSKLSTQSKDGGTPAYMSPEHVEKPDDVGAASDVWALGVVLYEVLTGDLPFDGSTLADLFVRITRAPHLPLGSYLSGAPPELETIIDRCLRKAPAERYPDGGALATAMATLADVSFAETEPATKAGNVVLRPRDSGAVKKHAATELEVDDVAEPFEPAPFDRRATPRPSGGDIDLFRPSAPPERLSPAPARSPSSSRHGRAPVASPAPPIAAKPATMEALVTPPRASSGASDALLGQRASPSPHEGPKPARRSGERALARPTEEESTPSSRASVPFGTEIELPAGSGRDDLFGDAAPGEHVPTRPIPESFPAVLVAAPLDQPLEPPLGLDIDLDRPSPIVPSSPGPPARVSSPTPGSGRSASTPPPGAVSGERPVALTATGDQKSPRMPRVPRTMAPPTPTQRATHAAAMLGTLGAFAIVLHRPLQSLVTTTLNGTSVLASGSAALVMLVFALVVAPLALRAQNARPLLVSAGAGLTASLALIAVAFGASGDGAEPPDVAALVPFLMPLVPAGLGWQVVVRAREKWAADGTTTHALVSAMAVGLSAFMALELSPLARVVAPLFSRVP